jgi:hypothetical protein
VDGMSEKGEGLVLSVVGDVEREEEVVSLKSLGQTHGLCRQLSVQIDATRQVSTELKDKGVRCNVLVSHSMKYLLCSIEDFLTMDSRHRLGLYRLFARRSNESSHARSYLHP